MRKRLAGLFKRKEPSSAEIARKRLQIIISADKGPDDEDIMANFKRDLLDIISRNFNVQISEIEKYVNVDMAQVVGQSTYELNITLPNKEML